MDEGYVLHTYGPERYVHQAVASVQTLRRHDTRRPVALYASPEQIEGLKRHGLDRLFAVLEVLPVGHRSIVGFKHHMHRFMPFDRSLFVDADMVWCRNPDPLWRQLSGFSFTGTGLEKADMFFGGPKGAGVVVDYLLDRRRRTMKRFGLTYLPRVQAGMLYGSDRSTVASVCETAAEMLARSGETHFRSRLKEGRAEETCEWSLAMAMSKLDLPVFHWFQAQNSPQLDYVDGFVRHDADFESVRCLYYNHPGVHALRGIPSPTLRRTLLATVSRMPGRGDHVWVTPFTLHFGWLRYKQPYLDFAERVWNRLTADPNGPAE